jgi:archaellum component FlaC
MTADIESLVLEHLRAIRATLADHGDRLSQIELQLSAMGQQLAGLTTAVYGGKSELDGIKRRVERIERRLELEDIRHRMCLIDQAASSFLDRIGAQAK